MDLTTLFGQLWGPTLLLIGIGVFLAPSHYRAIYHDLKREPFAMFMFGTFVTILGLAHVGVHNHWGTTTEMIVTVLGWGLLAKGAAFLVAPDFTALGGTRVSSRTMVFGIGATLIMLGGYLTWISYFV